MKLTVTTLVCVLAAGTAAAQSPSVIQNTRATMNGVSSNATAASNQALGIQGASGTTAHTVNVSTGTATTVKAGGKHRQVQNPALGVLPGKIVAVPKPGPEAANGEQETTPDKKYTANGRRDPFTSPVVNHVSGGSGCSTGKKCLDIGAIDLRGVVHSDDGFIAVVSNGLNKAYFLKENDPVFNGYVIKITGDSIVFKETLQDRLGKSFTREVVKKITTPAV